MPDANLAFRQYMQREERIGFSASFIYERFRVCRPCKLQSDVEFNITAERQGAKYDINLTRHRTIMIEEPESWNKSKANDYTQIYPMLILMGLMTIGFNLHYQYERYYMGEPLVGKTLIIKEKPEYIYSKHETSRYTFSASGYKCRFWISEGALTIILRDKSVKSQIESIQPGDTITVRIRKPDEPNLNQGDFTPRVIELYKHHRKLIAASKVKEYDRNHYNLNFGFGIVTLVIGTLLQIREFFKRAV